MSRRFSTSSDARTIGGNAVEFAIERLGEAGDGAARDGRGQRVHVVGALPGERVVATGGDRGRFRLARVLDPAAARVEPVCPLAETCGGCTLQHFRPDAALAWKEARVVDALRAAGADDALRVREPAQARPRERRRMDLAIRRSGRDATIGLHDRATGTVVDMSTCHVLHPRLFALLAPFRAVAGSLGALVGADPSLAVNLLDTGPDLLLRTGRPPSVTDRERLAAFAVANGVSRVAWSDGGSGRTPADPDLIAQLGPTRIRFGDRDVEPPPGAFLQACASTEAAIVADVLEAMPAPANRRAPVVELFAGCGTLTLPIAGHAPVRAYEGDHGALSCLEKAAAGTRVDVRRRHLARDPVSASELRDASAIVVDPPHGGAGRQMTAVADAQVPVVVLVSCNPASLRRDAAILLDAGYRAETARAIDQFLWSAQVESVSVFRSEKPRRRR